MRAEFSVGTTGARVRKRPLRCDAARALADTGAFVALRPVAPPRLWSWVADAALAAVDEAWARTTRAADGVRLGADAAARSLGAARARLIEPAMTLDVQLGLAALEGGALHVALTEGVRVYRARGGVAERLFARAQRPAGAIAGAPYLGVELVVRGDLVLLGTRDTFHPHALAALATLLSRWPSAPPGEACAAVLAPSRELGAGAALAVARVP